MLDAIKKRRACRNFNKSKEVEKEKIEEIVNAGLLAPSGMNRQTPAIIVITNPELRDRLAKLNRKLTNRDIPECFDTFYGAPVVLLVIAYKNGLSVLDGGAAMENMLLEATNQGLSSCWIHCINEEIHCEEGRDILSFTGLNLDEYVAIGHVIIGYAYDKPVPPKEIKPGRVFYK